MLRARDAGLEVPEAMLARTLDCLERMRNDDGTFTYMLFHEAELAGRENDPGGTAGRGPLCALALYRGGRGSLDEIRRTLDLYLEQRAGLSDQLGKTLMHTGTGGQGSHYLMFDYANAAAAIAELPEDEREAYRDAVLEDVLAARTDEGAFLATLLLGRAYGTAMALHAFESLRVSSE